MRKRRLGKKHFTKEFSMRCSAKGCLYHASAFGGTPRELDLQWCSSHKKMLEEGKTLQTKMGFSVKQDQSMNIIIEAPTTK